MNALPFSALAYISVSSTPNKRGRPSKKRLKAADEKTIKQENNIRRYKKSNEHQKSSPEHVHCYCCFDKHCDSDSCFLLDVDLEISVKMERIAQAISRLSSPRFSKDSKPILFTGKRPVDLTGTSCPILDVTADGHCGFRAIAFVQHGSQSKWPLVRLQLARFYLCQNDLDIEALRSVCFFKAPCIDKQYWFSNDWGQDIADLYAGPFIWISDEGSMTFLPRNKLPKAFNPINLSFRASHIMAVQYHPDLTIPTLISRQFSEEEVAHWKRICPSLFTK